MQRARPKQNLGSCECEYPGMSENEFKTSKAASLPAEFKTLKVPDPPETNPPPMGAQEGASRPGPRLTECTPRGKPAPSYLLRYRQPDSLFHWAAKLNLFSSQVGTFAPSRRLDAMAAFALPLALHDAAERRAADVLTVSRLEARLLEARDGFARWTRSPQRCESKRPRKLPRPLSPVVLVATDATEWPTVEHNTLGGTKLMSRRVGGPRGSEAVGGRGKTKTKKRGPRGRGPMRFSTDLVEGGM